jgi:chromosome segregation ATPase
VELLLANEGRAAGLGDRLRVCRRWTSEGQDEYLVDGHLVPRSQYANTLELLGLNFTSPLNIVQQGRIGSIAGMS